MREARFWIGAADGHDHGLRASADLLLRFGAATWPHQMVRMDATTAASRVFTFLPNGRPAGNFMGATVQVCPGNTEFDYLTRQLVINRPGRIRLESPDPQVCSLS